MKQRSVDKYYLRLINATIRQRQAGGHLIATNPAPRYHDAPRRLGLRSITPENQAGYLEGHQARELMTMNK